MDKNDKLPEQHERERPHGDTLGRVGPEGQEGQEVQEKARAERPRPDGEPGSGDMDQPGMNPGDEMPD